MFKKLTFFFFFIGLVVNVRAQTVLHLSLEECLDLASKNNARLGAHAYSIEGAEWQYNEAKAALKPIIEVSNRMAPVPRDAQNAADSFFEGNITFFNGAKVGVGLPIQTFGKFSTAKRLAAAGIEAAREKKEKDAGKIRFDVTRLYYGILLGEELKNIATDATQKIDNQLVKEEETKEHSPYQIAKLKVFKIEIQRKLAEVEERVGLAREALRLQIGLQEEKSFDLSDHYLEPASKTIRPLDDYLKSAATGRPDVQLIGIGTRAKELEWRLEKKKLFPNLGLGGFLEAGRTAQPIRNLTATDDFNNPFNYTRAGVGLEIKGQFDIHGSRAKIKRLESEYYKVKTQAGFAKEGIALQIKQVYGEARLARKNLDFAQERKKLSHQMVFLSKSNIDLGVGEEEEYTDALQLYLLTEAEYFKSVFDYNVAMAKLEWKAGGRGE